MTRDGSRLRERLQGIVKGSDSLTRAQAPPSLTQPSFNSRHLQQLIAGHWRFDGPSCILDRRAEPNSLHGHWRVGEIGTTLKEAASQAPILVTGSAAKLPFVFLDLETTGLNGGAGTYAFLVGCGWFDEAGSFVTRQHLLVNQADERPMLEVVAATLAEAGALVSFNGKSFDAPVLEMRYLFHRLSWPGESLPHLDVLHPARRFWGHSVGGRRHSVSSSSSSAGPQACPVEFLDDFLMGSIRLQPDLPSCSLLALERHVLGAVRDGDVAGFDIPRRYFHFVRTGDPRPLGAVLDHNRLDLLSLAGVTARLLRLVAGGSAEAHDACEALALGRLYACAGLGLQARDSFEQAVAMTDGVRIGPGIEDRTPASQRDDRSLAAAIRVEALRHLALAERRARRYRQAAARWRELLEMPACPRHLAREATEALAIHHEHRVPDLPVAKVFALKSLEQEGRPRWQDAVRQRLARLDRKIGTFGFEF